MAIRKIEHVGIMVKDIEASITFYTTVLGLKHKNTLVHTNGIIQLAFLSFPGHEETEIELIQGYNDDLPSEGKVHHIALAVDDIESEVRRITELQVSLLDTDITTLPNGARYFFFYGPDGEIFELFQPASPL